MRTNTTERELERLICEALTRGNKYPATEELLTPQDTPGWIMGRSQDYNRDYCVDLAQLSAFLWATQPRVAEAVSINEDCHTRRKFLARLQGEITKRGTIDVLRKGLGHHGTGNITLFYGTPSPDNYEAIELNKANGFTVTRQLHYSRDRTRHSLDLGLFINGLPIATMELKNSLTKQNVHDAIRQYRQDRDPREKLFEFGRCIVHFALDDHQVYFCTHLTGKTSWFLPFNLGWNQGAGNPPNPDGIKTDYLWKKILTRESLTNIVENYTQIIRVKDPKKGTTKKVQIWPRYHQLDVVRRLLADAEQNGPGRRYLIQHSAGSGKSNSIAWLAHQLIGLNRDRRPLFDSIIVLTDRRLLDQQIRDTIKQFTQVSATVGHAKHSRELRGFIESGKKIIITTVQKFPFILDQISHTQGSRHFAIIIDEAHSSQGGKTSSAVSQALSPAGDGGNHSGEGEEEQTLEDQINRLMESRKMLLNASYFAFTATPKNKTLEIFGEPVPQPGGETQHRPFHSYTMKQAIQEGFILDVLSHYTPVHSYYRLIKTIEEDPEFDSTRAKKKLRRYVESHDHAIGLKSQIMVDHFHEQVLAQNKVGGEARAMVVTNGINRAIQYYYGISEYLKERKSQYKAIVAFSGEHEYGGRKVTEASINGFPSNKIPEQLQEHPYRFLICADKFQTGYDEPLMHTMYVDKALSSIKAVQTLSRLNRSHPKKHDVFVLDFMNDVQAIERAFSDYYQTTILSEETDPNKLHDLKGDLDAHQVYNQAQIDLLVRLYLGGADRDRLDPILDECVGVYREQLDEDGQVEFKGKAKAFTRTYGFLGSILPYSHPEWEKLSIFLNFLIPKLPAPLEEDLSRGILQSIDMDSYRLEKQAMIKIRLPDEDAEIGPVPTSGVSYRPEPEMEQLSKIIKNFNDLCGDIEWEDKDRLYKTITEDIPKLMAQDTAYQHARLNSDKQNARIEHDKTLARVIFSIMKDDLQLHKQYSDNPDFKRQLNDLVFNLTYKPSQGELPVR